MRHYRNHIICAGLVTACIAIYGQGIAHDFVTWDDGLYVTNNPHVQNGLTGPGLIWAFTTTKASNWHPLTWLSHMLDCQIYGLHPGGHHLTNLLFHATNTILLFLILAQMTNRPWPSLATAALFAVHPLHVESVAWVSERKDLLSTFCCLLAIGAYTQYVKKPTIVRYTALTILYALALMAKPMAVTFPFVLLLLDYWPLRRMTTSGTLPITRLGRLVAEKTPLFIVSFAICIVTYAVQKHSGSIITGETIPLRARLSNAPIAYIFYLAKMFFPKNLAVYYPHPLEVRPLGQVIGALALLFLVTALVLYTRKKQPYLLIGWLWYLGALIPVIQIIQVGRAAYADRYTYIPLIGIFIMISFLMADLAKTNTKRRKTIITAAACALLALTTAAAIQTHYWRDSLTLFTHAIKVAPQDPVAHTNLGLALANTGHTQEAIEHYNTALQIEPAYTIARNNLGILLENQGRYNEALEAYRETLRYDPHYLDAHNNLGAALLSRGHIEEAYQHFTQALQTEPENIQVQNNLAKLYFLQGKYEETIRICLSILELTPRNPDLHIDLGAALANTGQLDQAIAHLTQATQLDPTETKAYFNLGRIFLHQKKYNQAATQFEKVLQLNPQYPQAKENLQRARSPQ